MKSAQPKQSRKDRLKELLEENRRLRAEAEARNKVLTEEPMKWIGNLAETIRANWLEWESQAGQLSQSAQDDRAGEEHLHMVLVDAITEALPKRTGGDAPKHVSQEGQMEIGITADGFVVVQFHDPEWWLHLTPAEALEMARLLVRKAKDLM